MSLLQINNKYRYCIKYRLFTSLNTYIKNDNKLKKQVYSNNKMGSHLTHTYTKKLYLHYPPLNQYQLVSSGSTHSIWYNKVLRSSLIQFMFDVTDQQHLKDHIQSYFWRYNHNVLVSTLYFRQNFQEQKYSIFYQRIFTNLARIKDLCFEDSLQFYYVALKGFHLLYDKFGYFDVREEMFHITQDSKLKIWCDYNIARIYPVLTCQGSQELMVKKIINIIEKNTDSSCRNFVNVHQILYKEASNSFINAINRFIRLCHDCGFYISGELKCMYTIYRGGVDHIVDQFKSYQASNNLPLNNFLDEKYRKKEQIVSNNLVNAFKPQANPLICPTPPIIKQSNGRIILKSSQQKDVIPRVLIRSQSLQKPISYRLPITPLNRMNQINKVYESAPNRNRSAQSKRITVTPIKYNFNYIPPTKPKTNPNDIPTNNIPTQRIQIPKIMPDHRLVTEINVENIKQHSKLVQSKIYAQLNPQLKKQKQKSGTPKLMASNFQFVTTQEKNNQMINKPITPDYNGFDIGIIPLEKINKNNSNSQSPFANLNQVSHEKKTISGFEEFKTEESNKFQSKMNELLQKFKSFNYTTQTKTQQSDNIIKQQKIDQKIQQKKQRFEEWKKQQLSKHKEMTAKPISQQKTKKYMPKIDNDIWNDMIKLQNRSKK